MMNFLEKRIIKDGKALPGDILKVDSFLNHQIDVSVLKEIGKEFFEKFKDCGVNKILTIESSGIAIAVFAAEYFACPVLFAKKSKTTNISDSVYFSTAHSYTHGNTNTVIVSKEYLGDGDKVLIIDDFLATGEALNALIDICYKANAEIIGAGVAIEKVYQGGGNRIRESGIRVEAVASIEKMTDEGEIEFSKKKCQRKHTL